jgi:hypothetical protein
VRLACATVYDKGLTVVAVGYYGVTGWLEDVHDIVEELLWVVVVVVLRGRLDMLKICISFNPNC